MENNTQKGVSLTKQVKKLMLKAFKEGQKTSKATEGIIKLWINVELNG